MTIDTILTKISHIVMNNYVALWLWLGFTGGGIALFIEKTTPYLAYIALAAGVFVALCKAWVTVDFNIRYYKMLWYDKNPIKAKALKNNYKQLKRREAKI